MAAPRYRLGDLAERVGAEVRGDASLEIHGVATLEEAGPADLSFFTNPRYRSAAESTRAGALLVGKRRASIDRNLLITDEPYAALGELLELYHPTTAFAPGVSPDARLGQGVELGRDVHVAAFAVLGEGVRLGDRAVVCAGSVVGSGSIVGEESVLHPRVVLYPGTRIGKRCIVHSGAVLGADGFGFATVEGTHRKLPQVGRVELGDEVEVGANSAVDRAMLGATRVGSGSKLDDLVMVAHGVQLGERSLLAAQAGIAGSARLGARAVLAGQAGVAGHLTLGDGVVVAAKSAVFDDVPEGSFVAGVPAVGATRWKRTQALVARLPELRRQLRELDARLESLEKSAAGEE